MARKLYKVRGVLLGWIVANLLGVAAIGALRLILPSVTVTSIPALIIVIPLGFAQWIALRRVAPISILWVLTISAGMLLARVADPVLSGIEGLFADDESVLCLTALYTTLGLLVGLVQWLFLRRHFARSSAWLVGSAVGLGLGLGLVLVSNLIEYGIASTIVVTLVYAIATGSVISWWQAD